MAGVIAGGTGGAGLGTPAARIAMVVVWSFGAAGRLILGWPLVPAEILAHLLLLIGSLVLSKRGEAQLAATDAAAVALLCAVAAGVSLGQAVSGGQPWTFDLAVYLLALLIARGNPVAGGAPGLVCVAAAAMVGQGHAALPALLVSPVLALASGVTWNVVLRVLGGLEARRRVEAARAAIATRVAREAEERYRRELAEILEIASPTLQAIARGREPDEAFLAEVVAVEAQLRDRIRSPRLQHPGLVADVVALRRRGVQVLLLGDPGDARGVIGDDLADRVRALIRSVSSGAVTIRAFPDGREGAASVRVEAAGRDAVRTVLSDDGTVLGVF